LSARTPLIAQLRKPRFSICIETVAVLAYRKFLIVSADSGAALLTAFPPTLFLLLSMRYSSDP
jgi:hypothetical protein